MAVLAERATSDLPAVTPYNCYAAELEALCVWWTGFDPSRPNRFDSLAALFILNRLGNAPRVRTRALSTQSVGAMASTRHIRSFREAGIDYWYHRPGRRVLS